MDSLLSIFAPILIWDVKFFQFFNSHHTRAFDAFFWGCSTFGSAWVIVPSLFLVILLASGRRRLLTVLIASALTLLVGALLVEVIKNGVDRPRPLAYFEASGGQGRAEAQAAGELHKETGGQAPFAVHNVGPALRARSFPSGHSWTAFAVATLLALFFGKKFRWAYLAAAAIAYSRIHVGVHFPLDVLGGAIGGTLLAFIAWRATVRIAPDRARLSKAK